MFTDTGTNPAADTAPATPDAPARAPGPRTPEGKRVAARNATTHGLFARDVVLPHLGEDPDAYEALLAELTAQLRPRSLLQRHYSIRSNAFRGIEDRGGVLAAPQAAPLAGTTLRGQPGVRPRGPRPARQRHAPRDHPAPPDRQQHQDAGP